jgi:hypothetical protein
LYELFVIATEDWNCHQSKSRAKEGKSSALQNRETVSKCGLDKSADSRTDEKRRHEVAFGEVAFSVVAETESRRKNERNCDC